MRKIKLTQGKYTIVDNEDYQLLTQWKWQYDSRGYASRGKKVNGRVIRIMLHRIILDAPKHYFVDHINRNRLDNRKENLRLCLLRQNLLNRGLNKNNKTGYRGVCRVKPSMNNRNPYKAGIKINNKLINLGYYATAEAAYNVFKVTFNKYNGDFMNL